MYITKQKKIYKICRTKVKKLKEFYIKTPDTEKELLLFKSVLNCVLTWTLDKEFDLKDQKFSHVYNAAEKQN